MPPEILDLPDDHNEPDTGDLGSLLAGIALGVALTLFWQFIWSLFA